MPYISASTTSSGDTIIREEDIIDGYVASVLVEQVIFDQIEYNELDLAHTQYGVVVDSMFCDDRWDNPPTRMELNNAIGRHL